MPGMPNRTAFLHRVAADAESQKCYALAMVARTAHDVVARSKLRIAARRGCPTRPISAGIARACAEGISSVSRAFVKQELTFGNYLCVSICLTRY